MKPIEILCIGIIFIGLIFAFNGVYQYLYGNLTESEMMPHRIATIIAIALMIGAGFELDKFYKNH